jgi:ABC-type Fe3+-hydroxamate transport system substrate-binding protein
MYSAFALLITGLLILTGCQKDSNVNSGKTKVEIRMTDAPGNFDEINLNVKEIILFSNGEPYTFDVDIDPFNIWITE